MADDVPGPVRGASPGVLVRRTIRDPQHGHLVEVNELALQAPALGPMPKQAAKDAGTTKPDSVQSP